MAASRIVNRVLPRRCPINISSTSLFYRYNLPVNIKQGYGYADKRTVTKVDETGNNVQLSFGESVKENAKSAGYLSVIVIGIGITAVVFYSIFEELFSSSSPHGIYSRALDYCMKDTRVRDALGEPIKAYGEESRRGRRTHIRHAYFKKDGDNYLSMQFYIRGIRNSGTVHVIAKEVNGKYEYTNLYVTVNDIVGRVINLIDTTQTQSEPPYDFS